MSLVLVALAVWRMWRTGEDAVGQVEVAAASRAPVVVAPLANAPSSEADAGPSSGAESASVPPPAEGRVVATFGWGSGARELGRHRPAEGNPEAPMSVAVDAKGTTWVLDQVNKRVLRVDRDGRPVPTINVPLQAAQDVAIARNGVAAVMDRLVDKSVVLIGADGKVVGELPLIGKGMTEGGASTGVFIEGEDSVVVERTHGDSVRIGTTAGVKDSTRAELPGRPSRDRQAYLTAMLTHPETGVVTLTVIDAISHGHRFTREYTLGSTVRSLTMLDTDLNGVVYLGAQLTDTAGTVLCIDAHKGEVIGSVHLPANASADETFRELAVSDTGEILMLVRTEESAELRAFTCVP